MFKDINMTTFKAPSQQLTYLEMITRLSGVKLVKFKNLIEILTL